MPKSRKIDAVWANNAIAYLSEQGHDPISILNEAHLSLSEVSEPDSRIAYLKFATVLENASRVTQDRNLGLNVGMRGSPTEAGLLGYIALNSPTLYEALFNATRFVRLHNEGSRVEMNIVGEIAVIELIQLEHRLEDTRQISEFHLSLTTAMFRRLSACDIPFIAVEFKHQQIGEIAAYERAFGVKPKFGSSQNALLLPSKFLYETAVPNADDKLLKILTVHAKDILAKMPDQEDLVGLVSALIVDHLSDGVPAANEISKELGMSGRTMARRLAEKGRSFRDIVDDIRHKLAIEYVNNPDLRLSEIAYLLGYSEVSAFNHAFKRWTGITPSSYR